MHGKETDAHMAGSTGYAGVVSVLRMVYEPSPALHVQAEWTLTDALIQNSDLLLSGIFLVAAGTAFLADI